MAGRRKGEKEKRRKGEKEKRRKGGGLCFFHHRGTEGTERKKEGEKYQR